MLCYAVLAILLLQYVNASSCPPGYDLQLGDLCYRAYQGPSNRSEASNHCSKDGGRLASIHNAFTNALILDVVDYVGADAWIGLICPDENAKNCVWDDGQIGADQFNAFDRSENTPRSDYHWVFISRALQYGYWAPTTYGDTHGYVCEVSTRDSASIMDLAGNSRQH